MAGWPTGSECLRKIGRVTEDLSLLGDYESATPPVQETGPASIADWQVDLLRKALDARGLKSMAERQLDIEAAAGRSVDSLRALSHDEALRVLSQLGQQGSAALSEKSAWDDRERDTWIDRL